MMMTTTPDIGIHRGVPFEDYLALKLWSQSSIGLGRQSMKHAKAAFDHETATKPTDEMLQGSALHCAFLEPHRLLERAVKWSGKRRYGKQWDAFAAKYADRIILTPKMYDNLGGMVDALRAHPVSRQWMSHVTDTEVTIIGDVNGLRTKSRLDVMTDDPAPLWDLKSVNTAEPRQMQNAVIRFGYHIQAAIYRQQANRDRWGILCVESSPPHDVVAYELEEDVIAYGEQEAKRLAARVQECIESGVWPGRSDDIEVLELPAWVGVQAKPAPTFGGRPMYGEIGGDPNDVDDLLAAPLREDL